MFGGVDVNVSFQPWHGKTTKIDNNNTYIQTRE